MQGNNQRNIEIAPTKIKERTCEIVDRKAPEPDGEHGYWIKMLK